jgi:alpha-N-arabinofuranosidase
VYDEWNVWFRNMTGALEERYVFADALAVGTFLNIFVRNCAKVAMANLAQMVNAIAPIVTTPETALVQPIYYPVLLHAQSHLTTAIDAFVDGPVVSAPEELASPWLTRVKDLGPFSLVDVAASTDDRRGAVAITMVNRSEQEERVEIVVRDASFAGAARIRCLSGPGHPSSVAGVEATEVSEGTEDPKGATLVLLLPPRSFTAVESALRSG